MGHGVWRTEPGISRLELGAWSVVRRTGRLSPSDSHFLETSPPPTSSLLSPAFGSPHATNLSSFATKVLPLRASDVVH